MSRRIVIYPGTFDPLTFGGFIQILRRKNFCPENRNFI